MTTQATRRQETREKLVQAARELFRTKGFDATTVEDIVQGAGVARSSFFRYFPTKTDIAFPYEDERLARFAALLDEHYDAVNPVSGASRAMHAYVLEFSTILDALREESALIGSSRTLLAQDAENDHAWEDVLSRALMRGRLSEVEARVFAGAVFGAARAALRLWFADGCRHPPAQYWDAVPPVIERLVETYEQRNRAIRQAEGTRGEA